MTTSAEVHGSGSTSSSADERPASGTPPGDRSRGQAHTMEAIVAGMLLLASVAFALQMTAVTPLSASTSSQHIENQQEAVGTGVLAAASARDALKPTILYWNDTQRVFHNASQVGYYTNDPPDTEFGRMLERSFDANGIAYNVYVAYQTDDHRTVRRRLVYKGVPSDNAVSSSRSLSLVDSDRFYGPDAEPTATELNESRFYVRDVGTNLYNVVRVEVVSWRI